MDILKKTYANTEELQELYNKTTTITFYAAKKHSVGGVRFYARCKTKVQFEIEFYPADEISYTVYFNGKVINTFGESRTGFYMDVGIGENVLDITAGMFHNGFKVSVTGVGLRRGKPYYDRVGGTYSTSGVNYVYMRSGLRPVETNDWTGQNGDVQRLTSNCLFYDRAYKYNRTADTFGTVSSQVYSPVNNIIYISCEGVLQQHSVPQGVTYAVLCDGYGLPASSGYDFMLAYTDADCKLHFAAFSSEGYAERQLTFDNIVRVQSAQRGTVFLTQNVDGLWEAWEFCSDGSEYIVIGGKTLYYNRRKLVINRCYTPTATLNEDGSPVYYYKSGDGALCRLEGDTVTCVGYGDMYIPSATYGVCVTGGEFQKMTL